VYAVEKGCGLGARTTHPSGVWEHSPGQGPLNVKSFVA